MNNQRDFFLSVIVPCFNEEENIAPFLQEITPILKHWSHEIIFIDDGSQDRTAEMIKKAAVTNKNIKLISFVRNFGHQMALTAGYKQARGDCVLTIDADLQDPPELIGEMINRWQEGFKIIYAKRGIRHESWFKRTTADVFYRLINSLSDSPIPQEVGDYRLLDRSVVDLLNQLPEKSRFLRGLVAWGGYPSTYITFTRKKRAHGKTHYTVSKMLDFALDGITAFSTKPLKIATYIGFTTSLFGFLGIIYALYRRFFLSHEYWVTGWTALFVAVMFFGGIQLITIGIIGEYIGKIYRQVQDRPMYLVKEKINL